MKRIIRAQADLEFMIRTAMQKCEAWKEVKFLGVHWHIPESDGCNWNIWPLAGSDDAVANCSSALDEVLKDLRSRFNMLDPG